MRLEPTKHWDAQNMCSTTAQYFIIKLYDIWWWVCLEIISLFIISLPVKKSVLGAPNVQKPMCWSQRREVGPKAGTKAKAAEEQLVPASELLRFLATAGSASWSKRKKTDLAENDGKWQDFISFLVKMADTPFLKGESPQALFQIFQVAGIGISKDNFRKGWVDYVDHDGSHGWVVWKKPAAQHDRCRQFVFPSVPSCSTQWDEDEKKASRIFGVVSNCQKRYPLWLESLTLDDPFRKRSKRWTSHKIVFSFISFIFPLDVLMGFNGCIRLSGCWRKQMQGRRRFQYFAQSWCRHVDPSDLLDTTCVFFWLGFQSQIHHGYYVILWNCMEFGLILSS